MKCSLELVIGGTSQYRATPFSLMLFHGTFCVLVKQKRTFFPAFTTMVLLPGIISHSYPISVCLIICLKVFITLNTGRQRWLYQLLTGPLITLIEPQQH
jgi:hypothetical protein